MFTPAAALPLLNYRELGQGRPGPPLFVLHGIFGSLDNWGTVGRMLGERFHTYLVDQRNHGRSFRSNEFNYEVMADDLRRLMESLGVTQAYLIGHSMGGKTIMEFASRYPQMIARMVVVDIAPRPYPPQHTHIIEGLKSIDLSQLKDRNDAEEKLLPFIPEQDTRLFILKNLYRTDAGGYDWRINLPVLSRDIELVGVALDKGNAKGGHTKIAVPTLFIRGANSGYIKERDKADIARDFAEAEVVTIADASHWVQAEQPQAFVDAVFKFLPHQP
jgi:esterase